MDGSHRLISIHGINHDKLCRICLQSFVMSIHVYSMSTHSACRGSTMDFNNDGGEFIPSL